jgi:predicted Zn-dependent protease
VRAERREVGKIDPATIRPGWEVKVKAVPLAEAATFRALRIEVRTRPREDVEFFGHVETIEPERLVVLKRDVRLGQKTEIKDEDRRLAPTDLERGDLVEVKGARDDDLLVRAREVKVRFRHRDETEERILEDTGKAIEELEKDLVVLDDPEIEAYLTEVGRSLLPDYIHRDEYDFTFTVIVDPTLNAFALPDGSIYVHSGLIARMENEAQLAAVIGHEIAHVTQKHYYRTVKQQSKFTLLQLAALAGAVAVQQGVSNPALERLAINGISLGASAIFNGYSRNHEDEADFVGLRYMTSRGYDPKEAPRVWQTFRDVYGDGPEVGNFFYGNHSTASQREENLKREIAVYYAGEARGSYENDADAFLRRTWTVVRRNAAEEVTKGQWKPARRDLDRILRLIEDAETLTLRAKVERKLAEGRAGLESAAALLERAVAAGASYAPAHRDLGLVYAELGEREKARAELERYLELAPDSPDAREVKAKLRRL